MCDTQRLSQTTFGIWASEDIFGAAQFDCPSPNAWSGSATECDYDLYNTVVFGNARITLWRKNVLCLYIRYLFAVANLGLGSYSSFQGVALWSDLYTARASLQGRIKWTRGPGQSRDARPPK